MNLNALARRFGETGPERLLGTIGLVAVTVAVVSRLLQLDALTSTIAWAMAFVALVGWNVLVFLRQRRSASPTD